MRPSPALIVTALLALVTPVAAATLSGEQRRAVLAEAQTAYDKAMSVLTTDPVEARRLFRVAAERFQLVVDEGVATGRLLYNLGNAYLQAGEVGRAILSYRRAEGSIPGDPRLEANLSYARSLRRSQITPSGGRALSDALLSWHRRTSLSTRLGVFAVAYVLFWLLLIGDRFRPALAWRTFAVALAVLWLACGASAAADLVGEDAGGEGVLIADEVIVRKGNGEGFAPQFEEPLHQGVEFELLEERPGWLHVRLPDGSTGWIRRGQAELI